MLFSSNKLLKLKYIHHYFFLKFLTKKITVRLMGQEIWYVHLLANIAKNEL